MRTRLRRMLKIEIFCLLLLITSFSSYFTPLANAFSWRNPVEPFVVHQQYSPQTFDPMDALDGYSINAIMQVCEGLYMHNYSSSEMELIPCLAAEKGTWNPDHTELTVLLKADVFFHDGTPFNASAVKWCFDRLQFFTSGLWIDGNFYQNPMKALSNDIFYVNDQPILNHTEIIGEHQIRFILNFPCVVWETLLADIACAIHLPEPNYSHGNIFFNRIDFSDQLIGTGPFVLSDLVEREPFTINGYQIRFDQIVFDYYPDYYMEWGENHIERMIYMIITDSVTASFAVDKEAVHWGSIDPDLYRCFMCPGCLGCNIIQMPVKRSVVYYIQMNLFTMKKEYRYASSFIWNHTYFIEEVLGGWHYELHVPVPDGMQYHIADFDGEPYTNVTRGQEILLKSADPEIIANLTAVGLGATNTTAEWIAVAESTTPLAEFNYTRYESGLVEICGILLQDYLKDIGIKLNILDSMTWDDWVQYYLDCPENQTRLCYSFGGWGPRYFDPITMIEPLFGKGASSNCFGLANDSWNDKLLATYNSSSSSIPTREEQFHEIQMELVTEHVPCFYLLQFGSSISFVRGYLDENYVDDLLNPLGHLYWFNCQFTPPEPPPRWEVIIPIVVSAGVIFITTTILLTRFIKRRKKGY